MRQFLPWPVAMPLAHVPFALAFFNVVLSLALGCLSSSVGIVRSLVPVVAFALLGSPVAIPL